MDKIPTPAGGAPDGAFERFLTAALATIITIMFSWRLLAEEEEANGATGSGFSSQPPFEMPVNAMKYNTTPLKNKMSSANVHDVDIDLKLAENGSALNLGLADDQIECEDVVYDRHDPVQEQALEAMPSADESMSSGQDDSLTVDTLTTWDEYKWEEEMGEEDTHVIKTRRNVRDFISDTNKSLNLSLNNEHANTGTIEPQSVSLEQNALNSLDDSNNPSVPFSQRFANFEYKDAGGDSGYIDLYPDVESDDTDSSDDEQVYEIQVSDSESEDERGGAFFGVTALDTIMEEFESDISDQEDASENKHPRGEGLGDGGLTGEVIKAASLNIDDNVVINDKINAKPCDTICDRNHDDDLMNYETSSNVHSSIVVQNMSTVVNEPNFEGRISGDDENDQISELGLLQNKIDINAKRQPPLKETVFTSTEANDVKCNLSPDKPLTVNIHQMSPDTCFNEQSRDEECDLHLNEVKNTNNKSEMNYETLNTAQSEIADTMNIVTNTDLNSRDKTIPESNKPTLLNLNDDDYKISEISDDSLPSSPIRTCALDNLTEEPFSDTESCSSESVITVLSVKSNESENYADRNNDQIQNPISFSPVIADVTAAGRRDLSTQISDNSSDGLNSKYDNYSLVSGFLNDSLNSLLSANTGSNENLSETESSSVNENLEAKSDSQSDNDKMNGKLVSDDSCVSSAESLPAVTETVQSNAVISENGHIDSNDSLNIPNEQINIEQNECNDYRSDGSSDSSDPPLREYDPDDDDLAEFQFDMGDDDDNDSFYLIIGDHHQERSNLYDDGALRNFDTFTNLNSIGLSPEYGDAVTSHTLSDDASGFKFAHTEEISTHYKKRSYITDRSNLSDSDGRSDGPLSPISSEDEENKTAESNESSIHMSDDSVPHAKSVNPPSHSAYQDAGLSIAQPPSVCEEKNESSQPVKAIDFKKYIIQNDTITKIESMPHPVDGSKQMSDDQVDESSILHNKMESVIDNQGDKIVSSGDDKLNNLRGTIDTEETLSSLTEKIQLLSYSPQPVTEDKLSDIEQDLQYGNRSGPIDSDIDKITIDEHIDVRSTENTAPEYLGEALETDIDADYEDESEANEVIGSRTNSKIETNIDDIFNDLKDNELENVSPRRHVVDVIPTKSRFETNIDDIFEENTHFLHANKAVETDIDEVLNAAEFKPSHSTPFKNDLTHKRETNIDDVIDIESHIQVREHVKHTSQTKRETSVDDLFESPLDSDSAKLEDISLSYDSFVDDLHESVPTESSHRNGTDITSESAIALEKSNEPPLLSSPSSSLLTTHNKVITPGGVQPDNVHEELELKQNIDRVLNVNANLQEITEPSQVDGIHNQIVNQDYIDDNDVDKIESITNDNKRTTIQTVQNIGTNYRKISNEQTEIPVIYDQNNEDIDDNGITCETNVAICDLKDRENLNDISESVTTLSSLNNSETDNREQLLSNLNTRQLIHTDYNANISLPKVEILNNNTHFGRSPETDNKYTEHQVDIPVVTEHQSYTQLHKTDIDNIVDRDGVQLFDNLLKLEDESDVTDIELKIIEEDTSSVKSDSVQYTDENLHSIGSSSLDLISDEESLNSIEESFNSLQDSYNAARLRGLSDSELTCRVVRTPATKPSDLLGRSKEVKGVKKKILRHQLKKYSSVLQRPVTPEKVHVLIETPHNPPSLSRIKVLKSREKFLSAENISERSFEDRFLKHRTSFTSSTPRKYLKRNEKSFQKSTESLPADMGDWNACYGSNASVEHLHSLPSPRQIEELYQSRYSSANSSFERGEYDKLHANCIFSAKKREEIRHTTQSLENMFDQLLRYGSISSLATETDLDAEVDIDQNSIDTYYLFQYPLERAASMSAIVESRDTHHRLPRKPGKGRFASRNVPKSKSLQTLETNLDDVFTDECEPGELKKAPSEHELRVSKSLSKLNVPDWFRKSSFSRSDSTQSLFTYARTSSTSTIGSAAYPSLASSPSPSVTPGSNAVIIQKRVTPNTTIPPSTRLLRAPMLPTTPERAPIHNTPPVTGLPSDKFRKQEKKELKPIAIVPFAKLREMFERKAQDDAKSKEAATSPTKEKPSAKVRFEPPSPTKETIIDDRLNGHNPVQNDNNERTISPPPAIPERKPILSHSVKNSESAPQTRRTQVHFSDEPKVSTRSQEQNSNTIRENGAAPSTSSSKPKKPLGLRASLPMPQFRFRRPGSFAKQNAAAAQSSSSQSKKGKVVDCNACDNGNYETFNKNNHVLTWLHALEQKTKNDGEILFEFLQKQRYSSILENGFAEQLNDLQDKDVTYNFPVMTLSRHSNHLGDAPLDGSHDLQVILTNTCVNDVNNDYLNNKMRSEASVDDILDGLLLLNGHRTGKMRIDENGRIVPKPHENLNATTPDTPPGLALKQNTHDFDPVVIGSAQFGENYGDDEYYMDYVLVKCEYNECKRETNLKEANKFFKSCHNCYTYYCSRTCRKNDWKAHKTVCIYSRINSACKHVIEFLNKQPHLQYQCSRIARRGYLSQGRGCIVFAFPDIGSSEDFLINGMESLWVPPVYISLKELPNASMLDSNLGILTQACQKYNPELKYVIHVAVVIPPKLPPKPVPRRMDSIIQKCSILRLSPAHMHPKQESNDISSTLILTAVPGNQHLGDSDDRKTRELCFVNIQRKLRNRGVSLRHQFPNVYNKLIDFVSDAKHFSPLIIYPSDGRTGRRFMCVIMPEAEPEIEWIRDPDLFHELDVFDDDVTDVNNPNLSFNQQPEIML